jgi:hypothetical protein
MPVDGGTTFQTQYSPPATKPCGCTTISCCGS